MDPQNQIDAPGVIRSLKSCRDFMSSDFMAIWGPLCVHQGDGKPLRLSQMLLRHSLVESRANIFKRNK